VVPSLAGIVAGVYTLALYQLGKAVCRRRSVDAGKQIWPIGRTSKKPRRK
jgi:hypothetical protein